MKKIQNLIYYVNQVLKCKYLISNDRKFTQSLGEKNAKVVIPLVMTEMRLLLIVYLWQEYFHQFAQNLSLSHIKTPEWFRKTNLIS